MKYLLDTSIVSPISRGDERLRGRIERLTDDDTMYTSVVTEGEMLYGLVRVGQGVSGRLRDSVLSVLGLFEEIVPITRSVASAYAGVKRSVSFVGRPIPDNDMWIAAIALSHDLTLVHHDEHFTRVPGLKLEDWLKPI